MSSKQTDGSQKKVQVPDDFMLTLGRSRARLMSPANEDLEVEFQKAVEKEVAGNIGLNHDVADNENSIGSNATIGQNEKGDTMDSLQTEAAESVLSTEPKEQPVSTVVSKRATSRHRKESLEEYRQTFLSVPKLEDRKPVFISREVRDRIDEIVHRLGGRGRSVSGFIENLARHHLDIYNDDVEMWKKL